MNLNDFSVLALWTALALYALAFIAFTFDLARRSSEVRLSAESAVPSAVERNAGASTAAGAAGSRGSGTLTVERPATPSNGARVTASRSPSLRVGVALTVLGFLVHLAATITRGIAAERVPWANMYEFAMTGTLLIISVFLVVLTREDLRFLGTFVTGLVVVLLGLSWNFYVEIAPLPPALQSAWLVVHVFVASLGTAFLALGFALSVVQLIQSRQEAMKLELSKLRLRFLATLPSAERLENMAYRVSIIGFIFWTFTLIAGAIWAESAWGRYWGWDTKEVWTFIIWVIYAGYIHARATRGWRGTRSAWLSIIGFAAVMFNFGVVNVFFKGLHAYSGL
ncbi:cytochrome c-type biogenesis protein CcsB [Labedella gwakjiensis]|uniref:C-type cytochrome biogenesis protein CcsB n=1 Tax=Labedella gwakjiensis TaxID=390269 RepID=A0A2P8GSY6_9MICO|nr:c-type cytochrome biogenesis protein CcsB [Labedella gwakjiensis]PSL37064.1 cytochrome c-type biogenesis protein CcsB [Labedella gwakjiensis]RUQ82029.1 c-type cytochrome biogenesis protein CcsB [Labedella gwakjiensis]